MQALNSIHPGWGIAAVRIIAGYSRWAPGIGGFTTFMTQLGFPAPGVLAPLIAALVLIGGLLLIVGLGTRVLGLLFLGEFIVTAFIVKLFRGTPFDVARIDLMLIAAALLFLLAGPGKASVDELLARRRGAGIGA